MSVPTVAASLHYDFRNDPDDGGPTKRYWFCGSGCLRAFADDPAAYVKA
jgi:YHS domain-containing protein